MEQDTTIIMNRTRRPLKSKELQLAGLANSLTAEPAQAHLIVFTAFGHWWIPFTSNTCDQLIPWVGICFESYYIRFVS